MWTERWAMLAGGEFPIGTTVSVMTIAIQALATILIIKLGRMSGKRLSQRRKIMTVIIVMGTTGTLLTIAHFIEVAVWAEVYLLLGVIRPQDCYYLAFVNFTTLGYGDIVPVHEWRLLGPITAANGMLLFGWSTAVMFAVLSRAILFLRLR